MQPVRRHTMYTMKGRINGSEKKSKQLQFQNKIYTIGFSICQVFKRYHLAEAGNCWNLYIPLHACIALKRAWIYLQNKFHNYYIDYLQLLINII